MNHRFTQLLYSPVALVFTAIFLALNLILLPFAYFAAIYKKCMLLRGKNQLNNKVASLVSKQFKAASCQDILIFIVLGIPMLLLAQVRDTYQFLMLTYRSDVREFNLSAQEEHIMTTEQFEILESFCMELKRSRDKVSRLDDPTAAFINTKEFILKFNERCKVTETISALIFGGEEK